MEELQPLHTPDTSEPFWQLVSQTHGQVLAFSLARIISLPDTSLDNFAHIKALEKKSRKRMLWGICYLTPQGLFFHHFPHSNFLSTLFKQDTDYEFCLHIPFDAITQWYTPPSPTRNTFFLANKEVVAYIHGTIQYTPLTNTTTSTTYSHNEITTEQSCVHVLSFEQQGQDIITLLHTGMKERIYEHS